MGDDAEAVIFKVVPVLHRSPVLSLFELGTEAIGAALKRPDRDGLHRWKGARFRGLRSVRDAAIHEPSEVISFMDLSKDGDLLVTASLRGTVSVWDANTGERVADPLLHPTRIFSARFCPDSSRLLTTGEDGQARLWDWRDGSLLKPPFDHPDPVYDGAFTASGDWCLTACRDGAIRIWDCAHGGPMMPPLEVGTHAFEIRLDGTGSQAVFGRMGSEITLLSLQKFEENRRETAESLRLLAEVVAGSEVSGGSYRRLDSAAWLERFQRQ